MPTQHGAAPVTAFIEAGFLLARAKFPTEHQAWIDVSLRLPGHVPIASMMGDLQRIGDLDLTLRAMEDERRPVASNALQQGPDWAYHFQKMLSEIWVLAGYEVLRVLRQRGREAARNSDSNAPKPGPGTGLDASFSQIFRDLELLRMPLAKYEIAKDDKMKSPLTMRPYGQDGAGNDRIYDKNDPARSHIMPTGQSARGSITWLVFDHSVPREYWVERRALADRLLEFQRLKG